MECFIFRIGYELREQIILILISCDLEYFLLIMLLIILFIALVISTSIGRKQIFSYIYSFVFLTTDHI